MCILFDEYLIRIHIFNNSRTYKWIKCLICFYVCCYVYLLLIGMNNAYLYNESRALESARVMPIIIDHYAYHASMIYENQLL